MGRGRNLRLEGRISGQKGRNMSHRAMLWVGSLVVGMSLAVMPSASAQTVCAGTSNTIVQCVDPTGGTPIQDCIYLLIPPCHPVSVPTPYVYCTGGDIGQDIFVCR